MREGPQNTARDVVFACWQSEAGQGDHGVTAPVAEPVIAGDDRFLISAGDDVLVGSRGKAAGKLVFKRGGSHRVSTASNLTQPIIDHVRHIAALGGCNHRGLAAGAQVESQNTRIEQIFGEIQPAFALGLVFEIPVPVACLLQFGRIVSQVQRR